MHELAWNRVGMFMHTRCIISRIYLRGRVKSTKSMKNMRHENLALYGMPLSCQQSSTGTQTLKLSSYVASSCRTSKYACDVCKQLWAGLHMGSHIRTRATEILSIEQKSLTHCFYSGTYTEPCLQKKCVMLWQLLQVIWQLLQLTGKKWARFNNGSFPTLAQQWPCSQHPRPY